jgi:monoamine oxidase
MTISRRAFLSGTAAAVVAPHAAFAAVPREADIVVIGAGAAGIAAARRITAAGRKVVVVEAADRVGGRCVTDTASFSVPFDRGARWIYQPDVNPVMKLARPAGIDVFPAAQAQKIRIGRRHARASEIEEFLTTSVRMSRAVADAARGRSDAPVAEALRNTPGDWAATAAFNTYVQGFGKELSEISSFDATRAVPRDGGALARQGLGTLVAKLADGLPLSLSTPATSVNWSGGQRGLDVETPLGRVAARAIIVTVSTNVLRSGRIKFTPDLPKRQLDAAAGLTLGSIDRIVLELQGNPLGLSRDDMVIEKFDTNRTGTLFANLGGSSLCMIEVAGSFGRDLAAAGEPAMVAFATEWLTKMYGGDVAAAVKRSQATRWNLNPLVQGAMSVASPGNSAARRTLMEPLGGLYFAGEAAHETLWGTVGGAWESGERAAEAALRRIGALRDPEEPKRPARKR